ncbi:MAG: glycosyltransferase family 2 protein [Thermoguttaceae bacterium]
MPVYNEAAHVTGAVAGALCYCHDVLVVDDGSTDGTAALLHPRDDVHLIVHPANRGYGAALRTAFDFALRGGYDVLVTIDCDGQHQPQLIPKFVERLQADDADVVSGSRYLRRFPGDSEPPGDRRRINQLVLEELRRRLGLSLTDAFCGFKAYRVSSLARMHTVESGYAMPLELWARAAQWGMRIVEMPVPMIYLDPNRSFGGVLDDADTRLAMYRSVLDAALRESWPRGRRWSTPPEDRGVLVDPPWDRVAELVAENRRILRENTCDIAGRSLVSVSQQARAELLAAARQWTGTYQNVDDSSPDPDAPIFLSGHQPTMYHPGVWFKNYALDRLAKLHGATAVNLVIDGDVPTDLSLPVIGGTPDDPQVARVAFDRAEPNVSFECREIEDREQFATFGRRVIQQLGGLVSEPLMVRYWPLALARARQTDNLGACLAQARHQLEASLWDARTLETPQSAMCSGRAFGWFLADLLNRLPKFHAIYNQALREYRHVYRVRSHSHPAAELAADGPWLESPLWVSTGDDPRRRRLFVRRSGNELVLADRQSFEACVPTDDRAVERFWELQHSGVRIRTRAMLTTFWARLVLGDLFIHGIGGAKYDRMTDRLFERFLGIRPPRYLTVSGTWRLPIACEPVDPDAARTLERQLRELTYHPERFLEAAVACDGAAAAKRQWIETSPTRENAKQRCLAIRHQNAEMQPQVAPLRIELERRLADAERRLRAERILRSREYAFCLFPAEDLKGFLEVSV